MENTKHKKSVAELYVEQVEMATKDLMINANGKPVNGKTRRPYKGVNQLILLDQQRIHHYNSYLWFTRNYIISEESPFKIKDGEKGTMIFTNKLYKTGELRKKKDSNETYEVQEKRLTYYYVFNKDQLVGKE